MSTHFAEEQKLSASTTTDIQNPVERLMQTDAGALCSARHQRAARNFTEARDEVIRLRRDGHSEQADALLESRFVPSASST